MTDALHHPSTLTAGLVALLAGAVAAPALWRWSPVAPAVVASIATVALAADVDRRERRLPDHLLVVAVAPVALVVVLAPTAEVGHTLVPIVAGAACAALPVLAVHLVDPAAMGFGDVKAAAVLGAALGTIDPRLAVLALAVAAGAAAFSGIARRSPTVAFGPPLVIGAAVALSTSLLMGVEVASWR